MRWVALLTLLLTGCATQPVSSFHTHKNLHVELSKNDKNTYSLVDEKGKATTIARGEIETLKTLKQSLMPANLADQVDPDQMRHLIAYLKQGLK